MFEPVLQQWRAEIDAGEEPTNLLEKESYLQELFADSSAIPM